jgi:hypothetical protein
VRRNERGASFVESDDVGRSLAADRWKAAPLMRPAKDVLQERPLGKAINSAKNNAPELLV